MKKENNYMFHKKNKYKKKHLFHDKTLIFAILFFISLISLFDMKRVKGSSMLYSFKENQLLLIFKAMYGLRSPFFKKYIFKWSNVQKGDVVIFKVGGRYVMKRCYATDRDCLYFYRNEDNGSIKYFMKIEEKEIELKKDSYYRLFMDCSINEVQGRQVVPKGCLLLLGDNSAESFDSRDYGYITTESILGKVIR